MKGINLVGSLFTFEAETGEHQLMTGGTSKSYMNCDATSNKCTFIRNEEGQWLAAIDGA